MKWDEAILMHKSESSSFFKRRESYSYVNLERNWREIRKVTCSKHLQKTANTFHHIFPQRRFCSSHFGNEESENQFWDQLKHIQERIFQRTTVTSYEVGTKKIEGILKTNIKTKILSLQRKVCHLEQGNNIRGGTNKFEKKY